MLTDYLPKVAVEVLPPSTPLAAEVLENLNKYPHCMLLTRVGQFYEVPYTVYL